MGLIGVAYPPRMQQPGNRCALFFTVCHMVHAYYTPVPCRVSFGGFTGDLLCALLAKAKRCNGREDMAYAAAMWFGFSFTGYCYAASRANASGC